MTEIEGTPGRESRTRELPLDADTRSRTDATAIRTDDLEPYVTLQYIARMLRLLSILVLVGIVVEAVVGFSTEGMSAALSVVAQAVWSLMIAAGLWGTADLAGLAIDIGHDIRADRILLGRLAARTTTKGDGEV